jgi:hypothetical protein
VKYLTAAASNSAAVEQLALQAGMTKGGAAKGELVLAIFELANCFRNGWGIEKDPFAAKQVRRYGNYSFLLFFAPPKHAMQRNDDDDRELTKVASTTRRLRISETAVRLWHIQSALLVESEMLTPPPPCDRCYERSCLVLPRRIRL